MRKQLLLGVSAATLLGWSSHAMAQSTAANSTSLDEVVVTAQRTKQNLEDVPIAVTSFSAKQLATVQINNTIDITKFIPNMFANNNTGTGSGNVYFLRGLGQTESFPTFDPQVGTYVDDIYIGRVSAANFGLFDVDQAQVLRGPQGTLFGRNSTGGAIVLTLAKPSATPGGYVDFGYGAYNRVFGQASVNIPISSQLLTKTSVYGIRDDGYVKDLATGGRLNAHDDYGVREAVRILPASMSNVSWDISADYGFSAFNAEQNMPFNGQRVSYSGFGSLNAPVPAVGVAGIYTDFKNILNEPFTKLTNGENLKTWGAMSNIQVAFAPGVLNIITGYRGQNQLGAADFPFPGVSGPVVPYDESPLGQFGIVLDSNVHQYSQELKWTGSVGEHVKYTVGAFYLYETNVSSFVETLAFPAGPPAPQPSSTAIELSGPERFHNTTDSKAVYGQVDYKFDPHWTLTVGGRFTDEHKNYEVHGLYSAFYGTTLAGYNTADVNAAGNPTSLKTDQFTPRVALDYRVDPELMLFASATKGFQGGGWNSLTNSAQLVTAFNPETLWTYETGWRYERADHKLRINGDFFYNDVSNYQLITLGPGGGANFVTENAANMIGYGFEGDITYKPIQDLTLNATIGLEDGHYYNLSAATKTQRQACLAGNAADCGQGIITATGAIAPPENFPPVTATFNAQYIFRFDKYDVVPALGVQFAGRSHSDTQGAAQGVTDTHALMDFGVTMNMRDYPVSFTAECQNCTNVSYVTSLLFVNYYNTPGIWDIKVHYKF